MTPEELAAQLASGGLPPPPAMAPAVAPAVAPAAAKVAAKPATGAGPNFIGSWTSSGGVPIPRTAAEQQAVMKKFGIDQKSWDALASDGSNLNQLFVAAQDPNYLPSKAAAPAPKPKPTTPAPVTPAPVAPPPQMGPSPQGMADAQGINPIITPMFRHLYSAGDVAQYGIKQPNTVSNATYDEKGLHWTTGTQKKWWEQGNPIVWGKPKSATGDGK